MYRKHTTFIFIISLTMTLSGCFGKSNSVFPDETYEDRHESQTKEPTESQMKLVQAIKDKNKELFREALEYDINLNVRLPSSGSPLSQASLNLNPYFFKALLESGGNPNIHKESSKRNLIFEVLGPDRIEHLDILLTYSPNLEARDGVENTPLLYAAILSNYKAMRMLIDNGASMSSKNRFGYSALDIINDNATRECAANSCPELQEIRRVLIESNQ